MRSQDWPIVRALPLFADMQDENFAALMNAAFLRRCPTNVRLTTEGERPDFLHIVVAGSVELAATHDGRETTLDIIDPVAVFMLAAVIRDEVYLKSARTLLPSQILMVPAQAVRDVFARDADFARAVVSELAARYLELVRTLKGEKLRTGVQRLANWILRAKGDHQPNIELGFDKRKLASLLGMTPENLSRNLAALTNHGVKTSGRAIVVEDEGALTRFAKPNALID